MMNHLLFMELSIPKSGPHKIWSIHYATPCKRIRDMSKCTNVTSRRLIYFDLCIPKDPFHMDHFKVGRTRVRPTLHLSHAPANRVETGLDNRVRPTSEVGFDPVVSELEVS